MVYLPFLDEPILLLRGDHLLTSCLPNIKAQRRAVACPLERLVRHIFLREMAATLSHAWTLIVL